MAQSKQNAKGKTTAMTKAQPGGAVAAQQPNKIQALSQFLEGRRTEIVKILPPQLSVERVIKTAIMASMENPDIGQKCTAISIYRSVVQASLMGLTVGSGFNEGYFIRYGNSCTFRASYLGWSKVAQRSDGVDLIRASVVYAGDEFEMSEQPPVLLHKPARASNRGELEGAVAVAYTLRQTPDGRTQHLLYDFAFVDASELAMAKAQADKGKESSAWRSWPNEMRKKVAVRRLCKWLPRNEQLDRLSRIENSADEGVVDVPDPDIPSDMDRMVVDARFADMDDGAQTPTQGPETAPKALPDPEVVGKPDSEEDSAPTGRQTATSKLKGQMAKGKPKDNGKQAKKPPPEPPQAADGQDRPPEPPPPDEPDYGGTPTQADMEF